VSGHSGGFGAFVREHHDAGRTVVQPRMGFGIPAAMRDGLLATRSARTTTAGTVTLDSYTRVGDPDAARRALADGIDLNGYPICTHPTDVTRAMLDGVAGDAFAVQVRHGSAVPQRIITDSLAAGLDATEGGPVSYCLPYGRTPLADSVRNWAECCRLLTEAGDDQASEPHLESFGGCMLGQLCPPSLLVAITVLEALFFRQHGLRSVSVSYAQQPDPEQDVEAVAALRELCAQHLSDVDWHVVVYTYMGLYPVTAVGAYRLLDRASELVARSGAERLVVKTVAEAERIPTIRENVEALERAGAVAARHAGPDRSAGGHGQIHREAAALVDAVRELDDDLGAALVAAFRRGVLDVPYCLHPDNAGRARSYLDAAGTLRWSRLGRMPLRGIADETGDEALGSAGLLEALSFLRRRCDGPFPPDVPVPVTAAPVADAGPIIAPTLGGHP
jgi:methylaspartate mutase epsilon subunit